MKALVLRQAGDLAVGEVDTPTTGPGEVRVRVTNSAICGTDLKIFTGAIPVSYPRIMGHEMAGEVTEGNGDTGPRPGDRVLVDPVLHCGVCLHCTSGQTNLCVRGALLGRDADGGFTKYVVVPRSHVFGLPDTVDIVTAPAIQVLTTCLHAQRAAAIVPGQSVVIMGLGVAGQLHVQLARARGAHPVIGISRSAWKRGLAEQLGADVTLAPGHQARIGTADATPGGADLVIESTGMMQSIADALALVRPGGTLLLFGVTTASSGELPFYQLYFKEVKVLNARAAKGEDFPEAINLVARGAVKLLPLVTHVVPLVDLAPAIRMLGDDIDGRMKIVLHN